ncbi:HAD family hydrolase [Wukongibacter baidiensis]|uniref:HAD family hydrolase n=1 Tax=Wukongibacter baidiensis TaxID=1723361 RepID=UPI003D7F9386
MYNCIIFDVDGTLIDTEVAVFSSLKRLAEEELNRNFDLEELSFALGIPGEVALSKLGIKNVNQSNLKWNEYMKDYFHHIKVYSDIEENLIKLDEAGILTGIVTSKTKHELINDFRPFGLEKYLKIVVCADDTEKHKPNPEPILKFIEVSGINPSKAIYIGDTIYDMECAKAAGVDFALALWGAKSTKDIDCKYKLENLNEIWEIV